MTTSPDDFIYGPLILAGCMAYLLVGLAWAMYLDKRIPEEESTHITSSAVIVLSIFWPLLLAALILSFITDVLEAIGDLLGGFYDHLRGDA